MAHEEARLVYVLQLLIDALFASACIVCCTIFAGRCRTVWLGGFVLYYLGYVLALSVVPHALHLVVGNWAWVGKSLALAYSLVVLAALRLSVRETGLVLPPGRSAWAWTIGGVIVGVCLGAGLSYLFRDHEVPTLETILFQATMPGFDEELMFRGVGFALLARAFSGRAADWVPFVVTSLLFGFGHAVTESRGALRLDLLPLAFVMPFGFLLAAIRIRSRSLLGPLIGHNLSNTLGTLLSALP